MSPGAAPATPAAKLPVSIVTGFLGSGKTTVLNHLVKQPGLQSTAVIINEFGEIGIDHLLVETSTELMVELNNGCICCTIRGDLADKLASLAMWLDVGRIPPVERVIVETTGLADPAPIVHTLMTDPQLLDRYRLDRLVTVVDAIGATASLERFPEAVKQVAVADLLLLSKTDLIDVHSSREAYASLRARIRAINPGAEIREAIRGAVEPQAFFGARAADANSAFAEFLSWEKRTRDCGAVDEDGSPAHDHRHGHGHGHDLHSMGIDTYVIELQDPVDGERFNEFLQGLARDFGTKLLRMKGIFRVEGVPDRPAVVHMVQHVSFPISWLERWPEGKRSSKFVFITQDLAREVIVDRFSRHFPSAIIPSEGNRARSGSASAR